MRWYFRVCALLVLVGSLGMVPSGVAATLNVHCDTGDTITEALVVAKVGDTIKVWGTCQEAVTITTDRLRLLGVKQGGNRAAIDVRDPTLDALTIIGAQGVVIQGLDIQGGKDGLRAERGATLEIRSVTARNNASDGVQLSSNVTAVLTHVKAFHNGGHGIDLRLSSSAVFCGTIRSNYNGETRGADGIHIFTGASAFFGVGQNTPCGTTTTTIYANRNSDDGIGITTGSSVYADNATIMTKNNGDCGIELIFNAAGQFSVGTTTTATGNQDRDISASSGGMLSFHKDATLTCGTSRESEYSYARIFNKTC
jgi:hypothetical protein